uniref:Transposon protein, putative, unclassified n=2 Tax=Oryza sativa subsp. japonica TaxID=39947 RepID=Q2R6N4_ORYSJ|nr:transposon protein, putative, unclassified [Oryza sativa Japonica Group]ABA92856.1 transposon protein, putative, unclassified [Oryza sativa Japonica Group]
MAGLGWLETSWDPGSGCQFGLNHRRPWVKAGRNLVRLILGNNEDRVRVLDLKIEPPVPPLTTGRRTLEGDITRLHAITKSEPDATRYPIGFHPTQFIVETEEIEKRLYPNVGLTEMNKDTKKGDGIRIQMEKRKTIEIQHQEKKLGRWRKKTAENVIFDRNYATQEGLRISTSYFSLHVSTAGKGAVLLKVLQRRAGGRRLVKIHCCSKIAGKQA